MEKLIKTVKFTKPVYWDQRDESEKEDYYTTIAPTPEQESDEYCQLYAVGQMEEVVSVCDSDNETYFYLGDAGPFDSLAEIESRILDLGEAVVV